MVSIANNCSFCIHSFEVGRAVNECWRILVGADITSSRFEHFLHHHEWRKGRVLGETLAGSDRALKHRMFVFVGEKMFDMAFGEK